ncbi:MAG: hypothetical protein KC421_01825 [Anaerolineales bacterium]|nr:hypothetical protein [Anaerolineales bacterium]
MKTKPIFLILLLLLLPACAQFNFDEAALEESIFGEPISNRVEAHDHADHNHSHDHDHASETASAETAVSATAMEIVLVPSELVVGDNRVAVGLLDGDRQMIHEAAVHFRYYDLSDPAAPQAEQEADAFPVHAPDDTTTIFAHARRFERAGDWGLEVQARLADGKTAVQRIRFKVAADTASVLPGNAAPRLSTPTLVDVDGDFSQITSAWEPNPALYQLSLDEALENGRPTVLLLATPAFCRTRFCGPAYEIATELAAQHGDAVNFLHVEVYSGLPDPSVNDWELAPIMDAFGLETEPWVYVMDASGVVVYRAEGVFTAAEIETYLP